MSTSHPPAPRKWRLRPLIVIVFAAMVLPVFTLLVWNGYRANERRAQAVALRAVDRAAQNAIHHTDALVDPVVSLAQVNARFAEAHPAFFRSAEARGTLLETLRHGTNIASFYLGFADGSYRMATRVPATLRPHGAVPPGGTVYADRWIDRAAGRAPPDRFEFLDAGGRPLGSASGPAEYDPRARPWYREVAAQGKLAISAPYVYATTREQEITVAVPFFREARLTGVFGANVGQDSLSRDLMELRVSDHAVTLIVDRQGRLVAHADPRQVLRAGPGGPVQARLNELEDPLAAMAYGLSAGRQGRQFTFSRDGRLYAAVYRSFPADFHEPWDVIVVAPVDDFIGESMSSNAILIGVWLAAFALQALLIYWLALRIARPLEKLEEQVIAIRRLEPVVAPPVRSRIRELARLGDAVATLQNAIASLSAYVPRDLVRQLVGTGKALEAGGRSRFLTIMFADIESFSSWAEVTPVQKVLRRMSAYFEAATAAINHESGTVDKFLGDGVMAFWGAPAPLEDHAWHACVAALRLQRSMHALNRDWTAQGLRPLKVRIGIHSAPVLVGNFGSVERMSYTVMGDGVNVASRLESTNKEFGTSICVSHAVYLEAGERLWLRRLGDVTVRGRRTELQVYELLGLKEGDPVLQVDDETIRLCQRSNAAYEAFEAGRAAEAAVLCRAILKQWPGDRVAQCMLERCGRPDAATPSGREHGHAEEVVLRDSPSLA